MTLYLVFCHNHGNFSKMQVYFPALFQFNQKFLHLFFPYNSYDKHLNSSTFTQKS
jgi:hypothetical protein